MKTQNLEARNRQPRKKMAFRIDRSFVIVAAMIAVGVLLISIVQMTTVSARDAERRASRRKRIENMSQDERDQLARKSKIFFAEFDEHKRQSYRNLHDALENAENAEALKKTLKLYNAWLATLSPYERDELRDKLGKAQTAADRQTIIRKAKELQEEKKWLRTLSHSQRDRLRKLKVGSKKYQQAVVDIRAGQEEQIARGESSMPLFRNQGRFGPRSKYGSRLNSAELDSVFGLFASKLERSPSQDVELKSLPAFRRHVRVLHDAAKLYDAPAGKPANGFLDDASLKQLMVNSKLEKNLKQRLIKLADSRNGEWDLLRMLVASTMREIFSLGRKPSEEQLRQFLETLNAGDRAEMIRFRGDELQRWLEYKYNQERRKIAYRESRAMSDALRKLPGWTWFTPQRNGPGNRGGARRKPRGDGGGAGREPGAAGGRGQREPGRCGG